MTISGPGSKDSSTTALPALDFLTPKPKSATLPIPKSGARAGVAVNKAPEQGFQNFLAKISNGAGPSPEATPLPPAKDSENL